MWNPLRGFLQKPKTSATTSYASLVTDMHSHLLPGIDDGSSCVEDSLQMMEKLQALGFKKLCMTPHVMGDFFKNTPEGIREKLQELSQAAQTAGLTLELSCAAEYYLDEWFMAKLEEGQELLSFGGDRKYLLLETSYINEPAHLKQAIFSLKAAGFMPVLAHPERYTYFYGRLEELLSLRELGVLFQINTNSINGYYSKGARMVAEQLIKRGAVEFLGTDTHSMRHLRALESTLTDPLLAQALKLPLLNNTL
ncbi:capsular biosynthesis protein [Nibribacter ruber]|uniref:protein-tyrosine-phosphatase n=1 Tax=Nibribacter ruber TaxID=2698458 RepID=A0A6P1P2R2_9BACT|nr:CpsB/CapC family capsule biosynthesis tyrosine phosphatase [Nibribacter ruber]QHL88662.1 capsular biosynthesis protein [Nibribacter ruber]